MRFDLSDEDWALLEPLLPKSRKSGSGGGASDIRTCDTDSLR